MLIGDNRRETGGRDGRAGFTCKGVYVLQMNDVCGVKRLVPSRCGLVVAVPPEPVRALGCIHLLPCPVGKPRTSPFRRRLRRRGRAGNA